MSPIKRPRGHDIFSNAGPIRTTPRNRQYKARAQSSPLLVNSTARAISNARREAAAVGVSKTRQGWLESIASLLRPVSQKIGTTLFGQSSSQANDESLWQYIKATTWSYLGFQPKRKLQSMLDEQLWIDHRETEIREREERLRQIREKHETERQAKLDAQIKDLGKTIEKVPGKQPEAPADPFETGRQWVFELNAGLHSQLQAGRDSQKPAKKVVPEESDSDTLVSANLFTPRPTQPTIFLKKNQQNFKDQFQANFKSDSSQDLEKIDFITKLTGWSLKRLVVQFRTYQRFPNLDHTFNFKLDYTKDIAKFAEILCDRGFLKRNHLSAKITFEPVWGRTTYDNDRIKQMPRVYIPTDEIEPPVTTRPREFSMAERVKMMNEGCYEPVRAEWRKQTIYDLEFVTPSDPRLAVYEKEIFDVDFEVSRDDPRLRHLWSLAPSVRAYRPDIRKDSHAYTRLCYKQLLASRDYWYWQLLQEIEKRDRALAKVYRHFDLNRKRHEVKWNEWQRVYLVQTDTLPEPQTVAAEVVPEVAPVTEFVAEKPKDEEIIVEEFDLIIEDEEEEPISDDETTEPPLPAYTVSHTYLPNATAKTREGNTNPVPRLPEKRKRPSTPYKSYNATSARAWQNGEANLLDEDNFPSRPPHSRSYPKEAAQYQGTRLAKAFGHNDKGEETHVALPLEGKKKKVHFAQGHTETIFRPYEDESPSSSRSASPEGMRATKRTKSADGPTATSQAAAPQTKAGAKPTALNRRSVKVVKVPNTLTRPAHIGQGSSNPLKRAYQASLADIPREWRSQPGCFSAWDEDAQDAGMFYELDIKDGKLPKGLGTWEIELEQTRGPKRIRVVRENGSEQDFVVWDKEGKLRPVDWVPADTKEEEVFNVVEPEPVLEEVEKQPKAPIAQPTVSQEKTERTAAKASPSTAKASPTSATAPMDPHDFKVVYAKYMAEFEKEKKQMAAGGREKAVADLIRRHVSDMSSSGTSSQEGSEAGSLNSGNAKPRRLRRSLSEMRAIDIDPSYPIFNPFEKPSPKPKAGPSRTSSKSEAALPSPPLSNDDENSGKEDKSPGSKAKSRLTGLFEPVQSQKSEFQITKPSQSTSSANYRPAPFTVVEDTTAHETSKVAEKPVAESFQSEMTAPSSQGSEPEANNVLQPVVNDSTLPRLGSSSDLSKTQSLLPPAAITSNATPVTPSAAITAAEIGMFGAVKPSPSEKRGLDEDSGMDIDNTPQSAKKTRSPKELGFVTNASTSMSESFKPSIPASFDFGGTGSKPIFGGDTNAIVANANAITSAPYVFGGNATNTNKTGEPLNKFGAAPSVASNPYQFGGASAAPVNFGAPSTSKPAEAPYVFGGASKPAEKPAEPAPYVFGGKATAPAVTTGMFAPAATTAPSMFGNSTAPSIFGQSTAAPSIFGQSTAAPSIFGTSTAAPAISGMFGATSNAPASNGLFGAVSGVTAAPSFGSAPSSAPSFGAGSATTAPSSQSFGFAPSTTSAPTFGGNNAATSSASFTFGSTATTTSQPMQFGGELPKPTSSSFTSGVNFGSGAGSPAPGKFGGFGATSSAPSPAPSGPTMFGASNPGTPNPQPGASFGADMFGFQPQQQTNSFGRTIKTAVSRRPGSVRGKR
ncbi:hypothetical protein AA313_de0204475 [Arthrobotrys entomopaga]|nr:hypothetical protein AA313_de0204475 [Arthrobotrys entomopaga]